MPTTRRGVIRLTAVGVAGGVTGCLGGDGSEGDGDEDGGEDANESRGNQDSTEDEIADEESGDTTHEPWASFGKNQQNTSYSPGASLPNGDELWSFEVDNPIYGGSVVVDGTVYFGSLDDSLYAVDADDGSEDWSFGTGGAIRSTPAVSEGLVFVGSDDGNLYSVSVSGSGNWTFSDDNPVRAPIKTASIETGDGVNQNVVISGATRAGTGGSVDRRTALRAIDFENELQWGFTMGEFLGDAPAVSAETESVYLPRHDGILYSLNLRDGEQNWLARVGSRQVDERILSSPAVSNGVVYFGTTQGIMYAFEDNVNRESQLWSYGADDEIRTSPAVAEDTIYFGDDSGTLHAVSTEGEGIWTFDVDGRIRSSPAVGDGYVCFGTGENSVYAVSTDGEELWTFETDASVRSPPAVIDGRAYIGGVDSNLYAIE